MKKSLMGVQTAPHVNITLADTDPDGLECGWDALADGATVLVRLAPAPFAPLYGMLAHRFRCHLDRWDRWDRWDPRRVVAVGA